MKTLRIFGLVLMTIVMSMGFIACGDDDDSYTKNETGTSSSEPASGVITTDDGDELVITNIKMDITSIYTFVYNTEGKLTSITDEDYNYEVTYNPFTMNYTYTDSRYGFNDYDIMTFSFNSSGYATKIIYEYLDADSYSTYSGNATYNLSYDSSGHLTKVEAEFSGLDGSTSISGTISSTLTWQNGNLTQCVQNTSEKYGSLSGTSLDQWDFEYANTENKYNQWVEAYNSEFELMGLGYIGILGKGSQHLPSSFKHTSNGKEIDSPSISYTLNSNGTINTETFLSHTYTYSYTSLNDDDTIIVDSQLETIASKGDKIVKHLKMFNHKNQFSK